MIEADKATARNILTLIREEETRSDAIRKESKTKAIAAAADAVDTTGAALEQSFNREQVQEQEQEQEGKTPSAVPASVVSTAPAAAVEDIDSELPNASV